MPSALNALRWVFFVSGMASLTYQVVWQRALTLHYGVGPASTALIVSVYMLGLGLGSLAGGILAERVRRLVLAYVLVELILGMFGLLSLPYLSWLGHRTAASPPALASLCMFAFLCIPTALMGATLPIVIKIMSRRGLGFAATVAEMYFVNTLGAATGALVAAYGLISFWGLNGAVHGAVGLNILLAVVIYFVSRAPHAPRPQDLSSAPTDVSGLGRIAWLVVLLTGFIAIGYEIVAFRIVEVLVKASPYAFATVLAVYLLGVAVGARWMQRHLSTARSRDRRSLFFLLQLVLGACALGTFLGYYWLTARTGFGALTRASFSIALHPNLDLPGATLLQRCMGAIDIVAWPAFFAFPSACAMGASFPLVTSLARVQGGGEGATVGTLYFFNTLGNLLGGAVTGFLLLPWLGTERTLLVLFTPSLLMGLLVVRVAGVAVPAWLRAASVAGAVASAWLLTPPKGDLYRAMHPSASEALSPRLQDLWNLGRPESSLLAPRVTVTESVEGVVVTYSQGLALRNYINGMTHGGRPFYPYHREAIDALGHARQVRRVLVIGFGTGSIAEATQRSAEVESITAIELNGALVANLLAIASTRAIIEEPRTKLVVDDARRFLLATDERYDVVMTDPLRTSTAYSNNLYSREFFELVRRHLSPGGILMTWSDDQHVVPRTVATVFQHVISSQWFHLASDWPVELDSRRFDALWSGYSPTEQAGILAWGVTWSGTRDSVLASTAGLPINTDLQPSSEYYLGLKARFPWVLVNHRLWGN